MEDYEGERQRTIRLKETRRHRASWLTPSPEYRSLCDDTLDPGPFLTRGTSHGFLETGNPRPDATMNLLMFGGSFVESNYCHEHERFASRVERDLPRRWRVLNGGYSGMSTLHLSSLLLAKAPMHLPPGSAVVIFIGQSDLEVMGQEGSYWSTKARVTPVQPAPERTEVPWDNMTALTRMIDAALSIADSLGLRYGVVASPFREADFSTDPVLRAQHGRDRARYRDSYKIRRRIVTATGEAAKAHSAPFLNAHEVMQAGDFYDIMHLNAGGQARFSRVLRSWLDTWLLTSRAEAEDMVYGRCDDCGVGYLPVPAYVNGGHRCGGDGMRDEYLARL